MEWTDDAVVIGLRPHGETAVIVDLLTCDHGRHMGFVHGGRSRRLRPVLQPGNSVRATWQARSDTSLGTMVLEPLRLRAARIMETATSLHAVNLLCALTRLLPEREPQPALTDAAETILTALEEGDPAPVAIIRFERDFLKDMGFGLDFDRCAVTGVTEDLAFVSPKTGRAVSQSVGEPYGHRVLGLPPFLRANEADAPSLADLLAGFDLMEHFLRREVFAPRGLPIPACRASYTAALQKTLANRHSTSGEPQTVRMTSRAMP